MRNLIYLLILPVLAACDPNHTSTTATATVASSYSAPSAEQIQAFQATVYAFGATQGCINCHASIVIPEWMNPDPATAYGFAAPLVDFTNPTASVYATYVANNHCSDPICANAANIPIMQGLLTQWAAQETIIASGGSTISTGATLAAPTYVTTTLPIPATLPNLTTANPAVMRFDLTQLTPAVPSLSGVILEVSVRSYNSANSEYKVYNPRIIGNSQAVTFTGVHVYVRPATGSGLGTEDVNQGDLWSSVSVIAVPNTAPSPLPTGPVTAVTPLTTISLGIEAQSSADMMAIGFAAIH